MTTELIYGRPVIENLIYSYLLQPLDKVERVKGKDVRVTNNDLRLLLAEMNFINRYVEMGDKEIRVVYIGASPGNHLVKLLKMYPFINFDLYDDQPLDFELENYIKENHSHVNFFNQLFELETCDSYKDRNEDIYLITDNRDVKYNQDPNFGTDFAAKTAWQDEKEKSYEVDMEFQKQVCFRLNPVYACLRFRPPHYYSGITDKDANFLYFKGVVWMMPFSEFKSTETRLVTNTYTEVDYRWNIRTYQFRMNYFNSKIRESLLLNPLTKDTTPLPNLLGNKFEMVMAIVISIEYFNSIGITDIRLNSLMKFYDEFLSVDKESNIFDLIDNLLFEKKDETEMKV